MVYELGRAFGRAFNEVEPPIFGKLAFVAIPEQQHTKEKIVGKLNALKDTLRVQSSDMSYHRQLNEAIIANCDALYEEVKRYSKVNAMSPMQWIRSDENTVESIKKRAILRLQSLE